MDWLLAIEPSDELGDSLTIKTTSLRTITFDTVTGTIIHDGDAEVWKRCDLIASGEVTIAAPGFATMNPAQSVKGDVPKTLSFTYAATLSLSPGHGTVCLSHDESGALQAIEQIDVVYNHLSY